MKRRVYILLAAIAMLFIAPNSEAAFYVKKHARPTTEVVTNAPNALVAEPETTAPAATTTAAEPVHTKKQSFFSRMWHVITAKHSAAIPQILYIILAIIPFCGALAIGLNNDFTGFDWLICFLLYFVFYFPGLIYALIKMGDYY